jgi:hypothetical protein
MGRLVSFFTGKAAPEADPTPASTALPTAPPTASPTAGSTAEPAAPIYVIRDAAGIAVGLARKPLNASHPVQHAFDLLQFMMRDEAVAGGPATEGLLREYYGALCRARQQLPWLSVLRHVNGMLKKIYGPAYKKTYKRMYEGGRLRNRRVYRIPLLEEAAQAAGQDVARVVPNAPADPNQVRGQARASQRVPGSGLSGANPMFLRGWLAWQRQIAGKVNAQPTDPSP